MPSILIEVGFLSNKEEEDFLRKKSGQKKIAQSIVAGIKKYKEELDKNSVQSIPEVDTAFIFKDVIFKTQIASSSNKIATKSYNFKGLKGIERVKVGKYYKYYLGSTSDYTKIKKLQTKAIEKGYKSAFIVAFKGKERISINELLKN